MSEQEKRTAADYFDGNLPTHEEIVQKLRTDGDFLRFAVGKYFETYPEMLTESTGDGISVAEARRHIDDGTL